MARSCNAQCCNFVDIPRGEVKKAQRKYLKVESRIWQTYKPHRVCELFLHSPMLRVGYVMVCWVKLILIWCGVVHKVSIAERAGLSGCIYYDVIVCCAYLGITCNHFLCAYTTIWTIMNVFMPSTTQHGVANNVYGMWHSVRSSHYSKWAS